MELIVVQEQVRNTPSGTVRRWILGRVEPRPERKASQWGRLTK